MSKPVQWAPPTPTRQEAETIREWPLRVSARARVEGALQSQEEACRTWPKF